jgi:hypothetical protein
VDSASNPHTTTPTPDPNLAPVTSSDNTKEEKPQPVQTTSLLRTAARRRPPDQPPASSLRKPGETLARQRARDKHNRVEQQYRHRLQGRFEALSRVLPVEKLEGNAEGIEDRSEEEEDEDLEGVDDRGYAGKEEEDEDGNSYGDDQVPTKRELKEERGFGPGIDRPMGRKHIDSDTQGSEGSPNRKTSKNRRRRRRRQQQQQQQQPRRMSKEAVLLAEHTIVALQEENQRLKQERDEALRKAGEAMPEQATERG